MSAGRHTALQSHTSTNTCTTVSDLLSYLLHFTILLTGADYVSEESKYTVYMIYNDLILSNSNYVFG